ncbi:MAG: DUF2007 domain-containing protein [Planctomycetota bacterium]
MQELPLVQVHRAATPSEAEIVKGVLEDAGIEVFVPDETTPLPLSSRLGVAGCEVLVASHNEASARAALADARAAGAIEEDPELELETE